MLISTAERAPASLASSQEIDPLLLGPNGGEKPVSKSADEPVYTTSHDLKEAQASSRSPRISPEGVNNTKETSGATGDEVSEYVVDTHLSEKDHLDAVFPPASTHPLFPPLPSYGAPTVASNLKSLAFRAVSFVLSLSFLGLIILAALLETVKLQIRSISQHLNGRKPTRRKFHSEEQARRRARDEAARRWKGRQANTNVDEECPDEYPPLEGGKDPLVCDVAYYARRVGLDVETVKVQTEDGFIIQLWHVYNPHEYTPLPEEERRHHGPEVLTGQKSPRSFATQRRYPVLLVHGLLQSAGAFCSNGDDSLAFYLCKSGYDVWLGNNRCGMHPEHTRLSSSDPRMWTWDIRHLGVLDLTALISRVLYETGFEKLGLVCHSQGTTETLVALSKEHRPELGERISVVCALAPAAYAGPLIDRIHFRFMRMISPSAFRLIFGIHAFIPFMMSMRQILHSRLFGLLGYWVFSYLFKWTDTRWDRGLRNRMFQFAPVYISAETIRWWLGQGCFATHKCILSTHDTNSLEAEEDHRLERGLDDGRPRTDTAWYGPHVSPFALWVPGSDELVDGRRLLRRLQNGREPCVRLVHAKVVDEYEHLDVLWAMDVIEQVGQELRQVLWATMPDNARVMCRAPQGVVPASSA